MNRPAADPTKVTRPVEVTTAAGAATAGYPGAWDDDEYYEVPRAVAR